jgi:hypothetical protein
MARSKNAKCQNLHKTSIFFIHHLYSLYKTYRKLSCAVCDSWVDVDGPAHVDGQADVDGPADVDGFASF